MDELFVFEMRNEHEFGADGSSRAATRQKCVTQDQGKGGVMFQAQQVKKMSVP